MPWETKPTAPAVEQGCRVMPSVTCHHGDGAGKLPLTKEVCEPLCMVQKMEASARWNGCLGKPAGCAEWVLSLYQPANRMVVSMELA